jgi:hypothetical protein
MRGNLPVTTVEYPIIDATLIVSKADAKGRLTYFNDEFVQASGFSEAEQRDRLGLLAGALGGEVAFRRL